MSHLPTEKCRTGAFFWKINHQFLFLATLWPWYNIRCFIVFLEEEYFWHQKRQWQKGTSCIPDGNNLTILKFSYQERNFGNHCPSRFDISWKKEWPLRIMPGKSWEVHLKPTLSCKTPLLTWWTLFHQIYHAECKTVNLLLCMVMIFGS